MRASRARPPCLPATPPIAPVQSLAGILTTVDWSDARLYAVAAVAILAGFVRGFSGFGAGMVFHSGRKCNLRSDRRDRALIPHRHRGERADPAAAFPQLPLARGRADGGGRLARLPFGL